jgi:uncharacterized membrane protein YphA (DoxX/SURF4 family)
MTLSQLIIAFALVAGALTYLLSRFIKKADRLWLFFLQNFVGVWFIFSGFVKAVDPMGTAFKMEQYFAAFEQTLQPTWLGFLAPVFPFFASYAVGFSLFMIVLEILLGIALIIGFAPRWTARIFFTVLVFFTLLTGFTYLTGYVPSNKNFFDFSSWGPFESLQMRVSDCGCFGDFLKLEPKVSFFKDLGLLIPGVLFLLFSKNFHQLWSPASRWMIIGLGLLFSLLFSWYNTFSNEPVWDFRAFKNGATIATTRQLELEAAQNVKIQSAEISHKSTGEKKSIPYADYLKEFKKYPKEEWTIQFKYGTASVPKTKVSDYLIMDSDGKDITLDLLQHPGYSLMISAYHTDGQMTSVPVTSTDSVFTDSIYIQNQDTIRVKKLISVQEVTGSKDFFEPSQKARDDFKKLNDLVNPFANKNVLTYAVTGGLGKVQMNDLASSTAAAYPIYQADDVLLKTIMRSNPGLILWKNGTILQKWHIKHLPAASELELLMK